MSVLWVAMVALAASPGDTANSEYKSYPETAAASSVKPWGEQPPVALRTGRDLADAVRAALPRWAKPADKDADLAAHEFLLLYRELQQDSKLRPAEREQLRQKVRGRLVQLSHQISARVDRQKQVARQAPKSVAVPKSEAVLGQVAGMGGGMPGGGGMVGGLMGGGGFAGGGQQGNDDYGQDLVDLIQKTIAPTSWDVNGGLGSAYYWRQQRAIVVRAEQGVHEEISELMDQLNRMGH